MTTLTQARSEGRTAPRADRAPSLPRLVAVELRKSVDTRAGFWLLTTIGLLGVVAVALPLAFADRQDRTLVHLFGLAQLAVSVLLPVVGILLITSEWSQRTALTTFSLVPHRGRVIGAKLLAMLLLAVAATAAGLVAALLGFAIGTGLGRTSGGAQLPVVTVAQALLSQGLGMLLGAAFGLVLLSSAAAIVASFVLPIAWSVVGGVVPALRTPATWLDPSRTTAPLFEQAAALSTRQWEQLGVSMAAWVVLPILVGLWRLGRKEIS